MLLTISETKTENEIKMSGNESDTNTSHKLNLPFKAYTGDEPYIFISYKHADSDIVYPVIKQMHDLGFNLWYDAGLPHGKMIFKFPIGLRILHCL